MFFGSPFGDRFWRSLGGVLEANMGPKTGQNGVRKGSEKKTNFQDDFGRHMGWGGHASGRGCSPPLPLRIKFKKD